MTLRDVRRAGARPTGPGRFRERSWTFGDVSGRGSTIGVVRVLLTAIQLDPVYSAARALRVR